MIREHDRLIAEYEDNGGGEVLERITAIEFVLFRKLDRPARSA
jgi:hypothetical protein